MNLINVLHLQNYGWSKLRIMRVGQLKEIKEQKLTRLGPLKPKIWIA